MASISPGETGNRAKTIPSSMAFQPIVNVTAGAIYAYEALVRGPQGQSAASVLSRITDDNLLAFDQNCRTRAMTLASNLGLTKTEASLSINFLPGAIRTPEVCSEMTVATARSLNFPCERLIFEVTESERVLHQNQLSAVTKEYQRHGFRIAVSVDDLGSAHTNRNIRKDVRTDILKLDMAITRNLHLRPRAQALIASMRSACAAEGTDVIAEGVESIEEYIALLRCGVELMQGFLFAMPAFESLPECKLPLLPGIVA